MKKILPLLFLLIAFNAFAQDEKEEIKTGWNVGLVPVVAYDSDLGFQYGGLVNFFDYGDGTRYPNYEQSIFILASAFTKGSQDHIIRYDSFSLLNSIRTTARVGYNNNQSLSFYGFNGYESFYNAAWEDQNDPNYLSRAFYRHDRNYIKLNLDFQDTIPNTKFGWFAGWDFMNVNISPVNIQKLNEGKDIADQLPDIDGLFDKYVDWGLIDAYEQEGGLINSLKFGLTYDSRNRISNPTKGIWTEALFQWSPRFLGNGDFAHNRFAITYHQYFSILPERLSFAYRLWYNGSIGKQTTPFFMLPILVASNFKEGFGGSSTMRGILMNRVIGDDVALGNLELRWQFVKFRAFNQNFELGTNFFFDIGKITDPYEWNLTNIPAADLNTYFNIGDDSFHASYGAGFKFIMNKNFVISADYGLTIDNGDGISGLYIVTDYLF